MPSTSPSGGSRPTTSPRVASRRNVGAGTAGGTATPYADEAPVPDPLGPEPPGGRSRPNRPSGDNPSLSTRLEGLASRGRLSLAPPPTGEVEIDYAEMAATGGFGDAYDDAYGDEYGDDAGDGRTKRGCGRTAIALLVVAAVLCAALVVTGLWVRGKINPGGELGDPVTVEVVTGQSTGEIGNVLEEAGIITDATVWTWYVRFKGGGDIQAGKYELNQNMSMGAALAKLQENPLPPGGTDVTIAEGLTIREMIERLTSPDKGVSGFTAEGLTQAIDTIRSQFVPPDQPNEEGTLFPETYSLAEGDDEADLVQRMVSQMDTTLNQLDIVGRSAQVGRSPYDVLVIASLIEEEAGAPEDRPMVARVIYNRLSQNRPLQIDSTSCYESGVCPPTAAELSSDSLYNTRNKTGLPPTPIAAPSRASIEAALSPAEGPWIFYVLDPNVDPSGKRHLFTDSEAEFLAAKQRCEDAGLGCG